MNDLLTFLGIIVLLIALNVAIAILAIRRQDDAALRDYREFDAARGRWRREREYDVPSFLRQDPTARRARYKGQRPAR